MSHFFTIGQPPQPPISQQFYQNSGGSPSFSQSFSEECIQGSAIHPTLFEAAIDFIEDLGRWETYQELNWEVSTQWQTRKPHDFGVLAVFRNEDGSCWQAKPEFPPPFKDGESPKYLAPKGNGARAYFPTVPAAIWERVANRYGVAMEGASFWEWLAKHPEIPIVLTEGGKKALSLLSHGYAALSLYGVNGGHRLYEQIDGVPVPLAKPELIGDLERFVVPGRAATLAFDQDAKKSTRYKVAKALWGLAEILEERGTVVQVASWDGKLAKGVDDLIVQAGSTAWDTAYSQSQSFSEWKKKSPYIPQKAIIPWVQEQLQKGKKRGKPRRDRVEPLRSTAKFETIIWDGKTPIGDTYQSIFENKKTEKCFIADTRKTAAGKSHAAGLLDAKRFGDGSALWYITAESRNPSTKPLESNFIPLPVRNHGMQFTGKFTPNDNPVMRPIIDPELPNTGNCINAHKFLLAGNKGLHGANGDGAGKNPICQKCPFVADCVKGEGEGYGFRYQRRKAMESDKGLRLNPQSAPAEIPAGTVAIFEEVSSLLVPVTREGDVNDLNAQSVRLRDNDKELEEKLYPVIQGIREAIAENPKFGKRERDFADLVDATLSEADANERAAMARKVSEILDMSLNEAMDGCGLEKAPTQVLGEMLSILLMPNAGIGGFVVGNGKITLTLPNERIPAIAMGAKLSIFLDATIEPEILCQKLGIKPHELVVIESAPSDVNNVAHTQVIGFGQCGRNRAESTNERLKALHDALEERFPGKKIEVADFKGQNAELFGAKIQHLSNSRGSNAIAESDVLIVHGLPRPNMGAVESEFLCIKNPTYSFEQYYQKRVDDEIIQLAGRLRANRRTDQNFSIIWVTDDVLPFQDVTQENAVDICFKAGSAEQKAERSFFYSLLEVVKRGIKITQRAIAQFAGVTQGRVSQWFSDHGGWDFWKNLLSSADADGVYSKIRDCFKRVASWRGSSRVFGSVMAGLGGVANVLGQIIAEFPQLDPEQEEVLQIFDDTVEESPEHSETVLSIVGITLEAIGHDRFKVVWAVTSKRFKNMFRAALLQLQDGWMMPQVT